MNLQYLRYALEISRTGSISKAAENLSVAQPNLSRAVKELESGLGISIFDRTRTGMTVTPEGERLLAAGERILRDVDGLEAMFDGEGAPPEAVSITAPHAAYSAHAFACFCRDLPDGAHYDLTYREVGPTEALSALTRGDCRLGLIRFPIHFERYMTDKLTEHELMGETIAEFAPVIVAGINSRLASTEVVTSADLAGLCELISSDMPGQEPTEPISAHAMRRLTVTDRAAREALLRTDPTTYERTLPIPPVAAAEMGLIVRPLAIPGEPYREVLIYPKHYRLSALDRRLIDTLREVARTCSSL